jgi:hypothetical protein
MIMKKFLKMLLCAAFSAGLFFAFSCSMNADDDSGSSNESDQNETLASNASETADTTVTTPISENTFTFGGYSFDLVSGTAGFNAEGDLVVTSPSDGIAAALTADQTTALAEKYSSTTGFYVEAQLVPTSSYTGNKNFGIAGLISSDKKNFSYAGVCNGIRNQLGELPNTPKGKQFGGLLSDTSYYGVDKWNTYYTIRYEYAADGTITGYVNGIQFCINGTTSYTPAENLSAYTSLAGIYAGNSFCMKSFKVGSLGTGLASVKVESSDSSMLTLAQSSSSGTSAKYLFLPNTLVETRAGGDEITYTPSAYKDNGETDEYTVESSSSAVTITKSDGYFTVKPVSKGTAVVTVKNSDSSAYRFISYTVLEAAVYTDTDYGTDAALYPANGAKGIYEDDYLSITFDDEPVLNSGNGSIEILDESGTVADTLVIGSDSETLYNTKIALKNFFVRKEGNSVYIKPHHNVLSNGKKYSVAIPKNVITGTLNGKPFTGFTPDASRWSFTTRAAYAPSSTSSLTVADHSSSVAADYRTVQSAIEHASSGAVITLEKGTYWEIIKYVGSNSLTINGNSDTTYGTDVVIKGVNCNLYNANTRTRCVIHWAGGDLVLKNLTMQNAYDRNTEGTAQSEALYFDNSASKLAAYNCSFKGFQDTLLSSGKCWFYKCYVEGDTDFIWGMADVFLLEDCKIVQLDTSADTKPSSASYIFETRVSNEANDLIGKGYVLLNCSVASLHPSSYFARRASPKTSSENYYDQVAIINTNFYGDLDCSAAKTDFLGWSTGNEPMYIAKDSNGNMNVGWKAYGGSGYTLDDSKAYAGTITDSVFTSEYSGRTVILNREYKKSTEKYVNCGSIWDLTSLETDFGASKDTSSLPSSSTVNGASGGYDLLALAQAATLAEKSDAAFADKDLQALTDGTSADGFVSWTNLLNFGAGYGVYTNAATITVKLAGSSVVTWTGSSYSNGTVTVTDSSSNIIVNAQATKETTDKTTQGFIYAGTNETTLTIAFSGGTYISAFTVAAVDGDEDTVTSFKVSGEDSVVLNKTVQYTTTVARKFLNTDSAAADTTVTWSSGDDTIATVDSNGLVTGVGAGSVNIKAVCGGIEVTKALTVNATSSTIVSSVTYDWTDNSVSYWTDSACTTAATGKYLQSSKGYITGNTTKVPAYVDASTGKLYSCGAYAQLNSTTIIRVPVSIGSVLTFTGFNAGYAAYCTVGGCKPSAQVSTWTATADGYVDVVATANGYINSISVTNVDTATDRGDITTAASLTIESFDGN